MKRHLFALLILLWGSAANAQVSPRMPGLNLDQWWPFCSATDLLDRTYTGFDLLSSAVTGTTDRYMVPNKAYLFNGINSELHYTTTLTLPLFGIADFTYSCWIYPTSAQYSIIIYNGDPSADGLGIIMCDNTGTGPGINLAMRFGGLNTHVCGTVTINQWHHLVMRRNGNAYILTVDNVASGVPYIPAGFPASGYNVPTTVFQLGLDLTSGTMPFDGKIDDIAIYSRQLSATGAMPGNEILTLYNFNPNIVFTLGADTAICPDTITLGGSVNSSVYPNENVNPTLGYEYTWSTGDTVSLTGIHFLTTPQPPVVRTLRIEREFSCPGFDAITVRHIIPIVSIGPADTNMCVGDTLLLNPVGDSTADMDFTWSDGTTARTTRAFLDTTYWLRIDSSFTYMHPITGLPTVEHCIGTDTSDIHLTPEIFVHLGENDTSCNGAPITIHSLDDTAYVGASYLWSPTLEVTPSINVTTTGVYTLEVTQGACVRTSTVNIVIANVSATVLSPDTAICAGASFVARATGTPGVIYQWTPTAGIPVSTVPNPTITPDTSAWYKVSTTIIEPISGGLLNCKSVDSFFVDVQPNPIVKLGGNRNICEHDTIKLDPVVTPAWYTHYIYDWTPGTFLDDSTAPEVIYTAGDTTKMILVVTTPAGCRGADSIIIFKYNGDFLSMATDTAICPGDSVVIAPLSSEPGTTSFMWDPPTYVNFPISTAPVTIKPIGNMDYRVIGTSFYGCRDTLEYTIRVHPAAVITLEDSVALFPGDTYQIEPVSNATYYSWFPPEGLSDTAASNPLATPSIETRYVLTARTQDGCVAKDSINIRLHEHSVIVVPNAFVPGSYNGELKVILKGIARIRYFRIYNRWGKMVHEAKNINDGWDGTIGGVPQPAGVYVYEAEAITDKGKIIHKQGNVTLLR